MATRLLNSGMIQDYQPVGEDGILVYQRADAFRSSIEHDPRFKIIPRSELEKDVVLELEKDDDDLFDEKGFDDALNPNHQTLGRFYADHLAIPKVSADGQRIDWYIPFDPKKDHSEFDIISWNSASIDEKEKALKILEQFAKDLYDLGLYLESRAMDSNQKLFARFLTGSKSENANTPAIHFPNLDCVFIVDGNPVITFWGFFNKNGTRVKAPFELLRLDLAKNKEYIQVGSAKQGANATATTATAATATATNKKGFAHWPCLLGLLALLLLLPLLLYLLWWWLYGRDFPLFATFPDLVNGSLEPRVELNEPKLKLPLQQEDDVIILEDKDKVIANTKLVPEKNELVEEDFVAKPLSLESEPHANAPLNAEDVVADDTEAQIPVAEEPVANLNDNTSEDSSKQGILPPPLLEDDNANPAPVAGEVLSNQDLNSNDISKLNGTWRVKSRIVDRQTNRPLQLEYNFKDGKGTATITQNDGVKCTANVKGGLKNGALNINSNSDAKCTDGSVYHMPTVECKNGEAGKSNCISSYKKTENTEKYEFPMIIHR